jgi:hypothetical protein
MAQTTRKKSARKAPAKKRSARKAPAKKSTSRKVPWKHPPKRTRAAKKLSTPQKRRAKARAERAGRPYPNLVDNMREAGQARRGKTAPGARRKASTPR